MKRLLLPICLLMHVVCVGQAYFQQEVNTKIDVRLDDKKHFLHGFETISYTNNSPDTLRYIYLHLWPNAYSSDRTMFTEQQVLHRNTAFYYSKPADRGYIDSLDIRVDGQQVTPYSASGLPDIARVDLPKPLLPGGILELQTPFRVKIPKVFSRLGHQGQAYYISQWFPKPAVYDRRGWHPLPYLDQGEFYSEIGSYDVQITVPKNYVVMATGNCETASENEWLDSLSRIYFSDTPSQRNNQKKWRDSLNRFPSSSAEWKTIRFREGNIHDFAWFADKRYRIRKDTMLVAARQGNDAHTVTIYTAAPSVAYGSWIKAIGYIKKTIAYLGEHVGPYPYKTVKVVQGDVKAGGGMEYPTIAMIDGQASQTALLETVVHEVGHNWFYGLLASNERDHAWMDEGLNTFYEQKITEGIKPAGLKDLNFSNRAILELLYYNAVSTRTDQALRNTSTAFTKVGYGADVYHKTALLLNWLYGYMGKDSFTAAMKDYYAQWHFKHPDPEDIERIFRSHTNKSLEWFFDGALNTDKGIDFSIKGGKKRDSSMALHVRNASNFPAPVSIQAYSGNAVVDSRWSNPINKDTILVVPISNASKWTISKEILDYKRTNDVYTKAGLLHGRGLSIKPGLSIGRMPYATINVLPALGYNVYDGLMAGVVLHNLSIPEHRLRYAIAPMYGLRSSSFAGAGSLGYWIYPRRLFQEIVPQVDAKTFHYDSSSLHIAAVLRTRYVKLAPSLSFVFKNSSPLSLVTRRLMLKCYRIWEDAFSFKLDLADSLYKPSVVQNNYSDYGLLRYSHVNDRTFNPFSYVLEGQMGDGFGKLTAEGRMRIDYNRKRKALHLRGLAGKYVAINAGTGDYSRYWLTSSYTASNDYLYDGTYIGRNEREGFASRQVSVQEGGGKMSTPLYGFPLGRSDDWLVGLNIKTDLPFGSLPVRLYLDACTYSDADKISPSGSRFLYTGGIELHALRDVLLLHIPLIMSQDYQDYLKSIYPTKKFANSISFAIQLQNINWLRNMSTAIREVMK